MNDKYLMKYKLINDIRIHQPHSTIKKIYDFPKGYQVIGTRFVSKLRELRFQLQGNNRFNIFLNPNLSEGEILFADENKWNPVGKGFQDVDVGVNPSKFNLLNYNEKNKFLIGMIVDVLKEVNKKYKLDLNTIKQVGELIFRFGEKLELTYKTKETKKYKVIISYQVALPSTGRAFIEYIDKKDNKSEKMAIPVKLYEDIFFLAGSLKVKGSTITLKSRGSLKSQAYIKRYNLPMKICSNTCCVIFEY
jgi:hypothetical protein